MILIKSLNIAFIVMLPSYVLMITFGEELILFPFLVYNIWLRYQVGISKKENLFFIMALATSSTILFLQYTFIEEKNSWCIPLVSTQQATIAYLTTVLFWPIVIWELAFRLNRYEKNRMKNNLFSPSK